MDGLRNFFMRLVGSGGGSSTSGSAGTNQPQAGPPPSAGFWSRVRVFLSGLLPSGRPVPSRTDVAQDGPARGPSIQQRNVKVGSSPDSKHTSSADRAKTYHGSIGMKTGHAPPEVGSAAWKQSLPDHVLSFLDKFGKDQESMDIFKDYIIKKKGSDEFNCFIAANALLAKLEKRMGQASGAEVRAFLDQATVLEDVEGEYVTDDVHCFKLNLEGGTFELIERAKDQISWDKDLQEGELKIAKNVVRTIRKDLFPVVEDHYRLFFDEMRKDSVGSH